MVAIIDYDAGNIRSVEKAVVSLGYEAVLTRDADTILSADHVILPGVGAFGEAMDKLTNYGLVDVLKAVADRRIPLLGICLGLQLMFEDSEEAPGVKGLGLFKGHILRIPEKEDLKIPHIGWNSLQYPSEGRLFADIQKDSYLYFVHSYYLQAQEREIVKAVTEYGVEIHASVEKDNLFACQFHPEKSSDVGMKILQNFMEI